jgi:hypothetical protein
MSDYQDQNLTFEQDLFTIGLLLAICKRLGMTSQEIEDAYEQAQRMAENAEIDRMAWED